ncbi:MAG: hypothetical protein J6128_05985 [Clostridia bacterium]|nr:hypothetical protein [Clostridia bacterium]
MAEIIKKDQYLMYKGKPLVRDKDIYCYGSMSDEYILFMQVLTYREVDGEQLPDKVIVQIMKTDTSLSQTDRIVKQDIRNGLAESLDIGTIWLERYLKS